MNELEIAKSFSVMGASGAITYFAYLLLKNTIKTNDRQLELNEQMVGNHLTHIQESTHETNEKMDIVVESSRNTEEHIGRLVDLMEKQVTLRNIINNE